jgi:hypothetical protein
MDITAWLHLNDATFAARPQSSAAHKSAYDRQGHSIDRLWKKVDSTRIDCHKQFKIFAIADGMLQGTVTSGLGSLDGSIAYRNSLEVYLRAASTRNGDVQKIDSKPVTDIRRSLNDP